jgi:predicted tellurium resistance membrane protein TerC
VPFLRGLGCATDVLFAVDSIPAIFATISNAIAVRRHRPQHSVIAGVIRRFAYLQTRLSVVLVLLGVIFMN